MTTMRVLVAGFADYVAAVLRSLSVGTVAD
jgi:hypothetical protein